VPDGATGGDAPQGQPVFDLVSGGALMSSASYVLVTSTAEGPGGNGLMSSPSYQLRGGLVGTTQP
jgi:hypothetical protein